MNYAKITFRLQSAITNNPDRNTHWNNDDAVQVHISRGVLRPYEGDKKGGNKLVPVRGYTKRGTFSERAISEVTALVATCAFAAWCYNLII